MLTFLIRSTTSQSSSYLIVLTRLGGPRSRPHPHLKLKNVHINTLFADTYSSIGKKASVRLKCLVYRISNFFNVSVIFLETFSLFIGKSYFHFSLNCEIKDNYTFSRFVYVRKIGHVKKE